MPMAPASEAAATSSGLLHGYIAPQKIGTSIPSCSVTGVVRRVMGRTAYRPSLQDRKDLLFSMQQIVRRRSSPMLPKLRRLSLLVVFTLFLSVPVLAEELSQQVTRLVEAD